MADISSPPASNQVAITSDDLSPVVNILTIVFLAFTILGVLSRLYTKLAVVRKASYDDAVILVALLFSIAQSAAVLVAGNHGLGNRTYSGGVNDFEKAYYASEILMIFTIIAAKLAVVALVRILFPIRAHEWFGMGLAIFMGVWGIASIFAIAFECSAPQHWSIVAPDKCTNLQSLWDSINVVSILTDFILVVWPVSVVAKIHAPLGRRIFISSCFASRLLAIAATVAQLVYQHRLSMDESLGFSLWTTVICSQAAIGLSIITACVPSLVTFVGSMVSGMLRVDDLRRQGAEGQHGYTGYAQNNSNSKNSGRDRTSMFSRKNRNTVKTSSIPMQSMQSQTAPNTVERADSTSSQARIIKKTTDVEITAEGRRGSETEGSGNSGSGHW